VGVLHGGKGHEAMSDDRCDRCGKTIEARDPAYYIWLWVVARVNDELGPSATSSWDTTVAHVSEQFAGVPEELIASEVYARRSYLVCSKCKEYLIVKPLRRTEQDDVEER
jgi:hypothetical protein